MWECFQSLPKDVENVVVYIHFPQDQAILFHLYCDSEILALRT